MAKTHLDINDRRGYQWPASALTGHEMELLTNWREKTGLSISRLLQECVLRVEKEIKGG